jgi:hypothetical protein
MISTAMYGLLKRLFLLVTFPPPSIAFSGLEVSIYNDLAHQRYNISISLGTPPQRFPLLLDTASTDVWVPNSNSSGCTPHCPQGFDPASSSSIVDLNITFDARYGLTPDLAVVGSYYTDNIAVDGLSALPSVQFAIGDVPGPLFTQGNWGIFGLGSHSRESVNTGARNASTDKSLDATYIPLWEQVALGAPSKQRKYSMWLYGQAAEQGSVLFGGEDETKYEGTLQALSLNLRNGFIFDWSVNLTGVTRVRTLSDGEDLNRTRLTAANYSVDYIFDTGSPNMYVPTSLYNAIVDGLGATAIINGAPYVPCTLRSSLRDYLEFEFPMREKVEGCGSVVSIRVAYTEIIYPFGYPVTVPLVRDENGAEMCYFGIVPTDGFVRLLGATFVRSAYLVFDADKMEIRAAQAKWRF